MNHCNTFETAYTANLQSCSVYHFLLNISLLIGATLKLKKIKVRNKIEIFSKFLIIILSI